MRELLLSPTSSARLPVKLSPELLRDTSRIQLILSIVIIMIHNILKGILLFYFML